MLTDKQLKIFESDILTRFKKILPYIPVSTKVIRLYKEIKENSFVDLEASLNFLIELENQVNLSSPFNHNKHFIEACNLGSLGIPFINFYTNFPELLNLEIIENLIN